MSTNPFARPATATGINYNDLAGCLLLAEPSEVVRDVNTSLGIKDAVRADLHVLDGPNPRSILDTLIFPNLLRTQLAPRVGERVLGRLGQGVAKPGQNAPWVLTEASEEDIAAGVAWLQGRDRDTLAPPAPAPATATAPAPAPVSSTPPATPGATPLEQVQRLHSQGLAVPVIAAATGLDADVVQILLDTPPY
jgi:hypothetical protein